MQATQIKHTQSIHYGDDLYDLDIELQVIDQSITPRGVNLAQSMACTATCATACWCW